eukprot:5474967-Alexandrium_andersonii.AAC.1
MAAREKPSMPAHGRAARKGRAVRLRTWWHINCHAGGGGTDSSSSLKRWLARRAISRAENCYGG